MKKLNIISILLIVLMLCFPVLAEDDLGSYNTQDYGFSINFDSISNRDRCLVPMDYGILSHDPFVSVLGVRYFALSNDTVQEINDRYEDMSEKDQEKVTNIIGNSAAIIAYIIVSDREEAATLDAVGITLTDDMKVTEFGEKDGFHFYFLTQSVEDFLSNWSKNVLGDKSFEKDLQSIEAKLGSSSTTLKSKDKLRADIDNVKDKLLKELQKAELTAPVDESDDIVGKIISFETTDLDGNKISSKDLFADNLVTMINVWGMWCGYCVDEMEELAKINDRLSEKGCGIIGVEDERGRMTDELAEEAKALLEEKGVDYPNVIVPEGNEIFETITGWPTTFFVDEDGRILTYPIVGANTLAYEETVDRLLEGIDK